MGMSRAEMPCTLKPIKSDRKETRSPTISRSHAAYFWGLVIIKFCRYYFSFLFSFTKNAPVCTHFVMMMIMMMDVYIFHLNVISVCGVGYLRTVCLVKKTKKKKRIMKKPKKKRTLGNFFDERLVNWKMFSALGKEQKLRGGRRISRHWH